MWWWASNGGTYLLGFEEQRTTMMAILSNRKKGMPKVSYRALKAKGKKFCARRLLLHKENSNIYYRNSIRYIREVKEANVQNINSTLSDLRYIYIYIYIYMYRCNRIYRTVLQRAGWTLPRHFSYLQLFYNKNILCMFHLQVFIFLKKRGGGDEWNTSPPVKHC
jgi:hypothetical protein